MDANSMAWLARRDGSVAVGHGPFTASTEAVGPVAFYVQDFALSDPKPWKIPSSFERITHRDMAERYAADMATEIQWEPAEAGPFAAVFQEVAAAIDGGIFEKTVPVVTETGRTTTDPRKAIVAAMARQRPPLQTYGWCGGEGGFAGATPELLVSLREGRLETMALAGTARSEDRDVFAVDEKEIREHEYVARTLVAKLEDLGKTTVSDRQIIDLESLVHFLTSISVILDRPQDPEEVVKRLHPTPALGPLPRTALTMKQLLGWRSRLACPGEFGAPFGLLDGERFDAVVAIRGIWWRGNALKLPAGCGVIEESRLVNEWRELRLKRQAVKSFL